MRQRNFDDFDTTAENGAELADSVGVGAIAAADEESTRIEPDDIAALEATRWLDVTGDRHRHVAGGCGAFLCGGLLDALRLTHPAENQTAIGHDRRVAHVDRVQRGRLVARQHVDFSDRTQRLDEPIVLARCALEVRRRCESQLLPLPRDRLLIDEGVARMFDRHA